MRRALLWLGTVLTVWSVAGLVSAVAITSPRSAAIPEREQIAGRPVAMASANCDDDVTLRGWLVRAADDSTQCVVLAAGIKANRLAMVERAEWYLEHGWSTLLVDLRGTGESTPTRVSMGWHESRDLLAWRGWLRKRGFTDVAAHGQSLGAAAIVYGDGDWSFAVLEACYHDIDNALCARLPWVPAPAFVLWPLRFWAEYVLELDADELRPIDAIAGLTCPTLFLCGERDDRVGPDAPAQLLAACGSEHKHLIIVPGVGHGDLLRGDHTTVITALADFVPKAR